MPAPIISGLINFLTANLSVVAWDGEVARYDPNNNPINPNTNVIPTVWPSIRVTMSDEGFEREWTTEDAYTDTGEILIQLWTINRADMETALTNVETLCAQATLWETIQLSGDQRNPQYVIQMLLQKWTAVAEWGPEGQERSAQSELLYRGDLHYYIQIHGAIPTL